MQIDHLDSKAQCRREGCNCSVPDGQEFCSEHCRSVASKGAARAGSRGSCGCGHAECSTHEPPPAR